MRTARFKLTTLSQKVVLNVTQKEENKILLSNNASSLRLTKLEGSQS
jgi:hypothetical protein